MDEKSILIPICQTMNNVSWFDVLQISKSSGEFHIISFRGFQTSNINPNFQ